MEATINYKGERLDITYSESGGRQYSHDTPPDPIEREIESVYWADTDVTDLVESLVGLDTLKSYL